MNRRAAALALVVAAALTSCSGDQAGTALPAERVGTLPVLNITDGGFSPNDGLAHSAPADGTGPTTVSRTYALPPGDQDALIRFLELASADPQLVWRRISCAPSEPIISIAAARTIDELPVDIDVRFDSTTSEIDVSASTNSTHPVTLVPSTIEVVDACDRPLDAKALAILNP